MRSDDVLTRLREADPAQSVSPEAVDHDQLLTRVMGQPRERVRSRRRRRRHGWSAVIAGLVVALGGAGGALAAAGVRVPLLSPAPGAEPRGAIDPRERLRNLDGVPVVADEMRTVPAPGPNDNASPWLLAPTREGGVCVHASSFGFCAIDRASVEAGRAATTVYPPGGTVVIDPLTGTSHVKDPYQGPGTRYGIAPAEAVEVVVLDRDGRVLRREAVSEEGAYRVKVPPEGSGARVDFRDASGDTIASTGAG